VGEIGTFYPSHSPAYFYTGLPNLTEEGPDFLPNFGGRLQLSMKPYLFVNHAYSEIYAGKLPQGSPWQTEMFGLNAGFELLGVSLNVHWLSAFNDPANFPGGTSGMILSPINGGAGWLNPLTLSPLSLGPQKEKVVGLDLSITRTYEEHSLTFKLAFASSDYKPNTNSSDNAGGQLYDLSLSGGLTKKLTAGLEYLNVDAKYSPFILPIALPFGITTATFPWGQWPFPVEYSGYYTLQNAQEYPQNREGAKVFATYEIPNGKITASYRWLAQKIPTQLTLFNNAADIQSIGFYEPLFVASGGRSQTFPIGKTSDWRTSLHYALNSQLSLELAGSGVMAKRLSGDVNNIDFTGWLGDAGFIYSFWEKWKLNAAYHLAIVDGRLLAAPTSPANDGFRNSGETARLDYLLAPKTNVFLLFQNLNHYNSQTTPNFRMLQFLTGLDFSF
jgi:hypothetical protein